MKNYSIISRKFTIYFLLLGFFLCVMFIVMPITPLLLDILIPLNESRQRFFAVEVDSTVNRDKYFLPFHCYTSSIILVGLCITISVDTMHIVCTAHACSLFAAISKQIENIVSKRNINDKISNQCIKLDPLNEEIIYREYIICIKKHQFVIEFVNTLESTCQEFTLLLLVLICGILCLIGLQMIYVLEQMTEAIKFVTLLIAVLVALLIICYSGQRLMDESQSIFYRAYAAEWYNFSPRLKSLLIMTLYRSNVPCGLKAGKMVPLCTVTYASVIQIAMSYFTTLSSLK
ncbi:odorant receptor 63a [Solenopsis invicta]|uniref:odorant receptor 63a n=1 Tax=Solenopsis invicta TaxID=13686 RepID=UPI00193E0D28|nr:odorant receptor 63a [Solenopsis invicta]